SILKFGSKLAKFSFVRISVEGNFVVIAFLSRDSFADSRQRSEQFQGRDEMKPPIQARPASALASVKKLRGAKAPTLCSVHISTSSGGIKL
ncbi:unnamed protein product, partial [Symbiodinium necroappetens]